MKEFTKSDLKNRMVVECRNGEKYIVIDDILLSMFGHINLNDYNEGLRIKTIREEPYLAEYDIMKVYDQVFSLDFSKNISKLLWDRSEVEEGDDFSCMSISMALDTDNTAVLNYKVNIGDLFHKAIKDEQEKEREKNGR